MRVRLKLDHLNDLVARSSISQNHWAIRLGLSKGHWSAILNGKHPFPSPGTRDRMLEIFKVEFDDLFEVETGPAEGADASFQAALADRYQIEREIGRGGMGIVYGARDLRHQRAVAIKVVSAEAVDGIGVPQFLKEVRHATRLQHPHILPVYDSGVSAGLPYYVTPYVEAGSLRALIKRRGALNLEDTLHFVEGISAALRHAHSHQVLHCDIKPENILVFDRHAFVADFGIARVIHSEYFEWGRPSELVSSAGTPAYVSPEQASGERNIGPASDVYSLACVVFEMMTGHPPFDGTSTMETVAKRFTQTLPDVRASAPHVPAEVNAVLHAATVVDPAQRTTSTDQLAAGLRRAVRPVSRLSSVSGGVYGHLARAVRVLIPRNRWMHRFMDTFFQDLRYSVRSLLRRPLFAVVVALTLALGIGMNTAIFSVLYGVLYAAVPYPEAERLMRIGRTRPELPGVILPISPANYTDIKERITSFDALEAVAGRTYMVTGTDLPVRASGARLTPGFFPLLGINVAQGRGFEPQDALPGSAPVTIISHEFWRDQLGAVPDIVGRTIGLDEVTHTIVGVMPEDFEIISRQDRLWAPLRWTEQDLQRRGNNYLQIYGRLSDGVALAASIGELEREWRRLGAENTPDYDDSGMSAIGILEAWVERSRAPLLLLAGAVGMVLLIACANVANLMLARAESRQRELAIRTALGAGRSRLIRQFLTEGITISVVGGVIGLLGAYGGLRLLLTAFGDVVPRADEVTLDGFVLGFATLVSLGTGVVVGLIPALQARAEHAVLTEGGRGSARTTLLRKGLVIFETGLAFMLVVGAGLLLRSFWEAQQADLGFERESLLVVNTWLPPSRYQTSSQANDFYDRLIGDLRRHPNVRDAALSSMVPVRNWGSNFTRVASVGRPDLGASFVEVRRVSPDYFTTMRVPLLQGRMLTPRDTVPAAPTVVINQYLANLIFPDRDPIGGRLDFGPQGSSNPEVVGVVGNIKVSGPDRELRPVFYYVTARASNLMIRTSGDPLEVVPIVRQTVAALDPDVAVYRVDTMTDIVSRALGNRQFQLTLLGVFAFVALALGSIGIYGVMSYMVVQRVRELGVRLALGATSGTILKLVLLQGGQLAALGLGLGLAGSIGLSRFIRGQVFNVSPSDPATYASVLALLGCVALLACYIPARRAAAVDPMHALRYE